VRLIPETSTSWVSKKRGRCGGQTCVRDLRIPVWAMVNCRRLGMSDAEILQLYLDLLPPDLEEAWVYAAAHADEIDDVIRLNEQS
jgi:uncharacterized protein (DUF433 family)